MMEKEMKMKKGAKRESDHVKGKMPGMKHCCTGSKKGGKMSGKMHG